MEQLTEAAEQNEREKADEERTEKELRDQGNPENGHAYNQQASHHDLDQQAPAKTGLFDRRRNPGSPVGSRRLLDVVAVLLAHELFLLQFRVDVNLFQATHRSFKSQVQLLNIFSDNHFETIASSILSDIDQQNNGVQSEP